MTINEYQALAMRTASGMSKEYPMILNGVLGLGGESGECLDIVKKHLFQGHDLNKEHLAEELGDVAWYLAVSAYAIGLDLESVLLGNVEKLRKRYPDGFDPERSLHREN
jgi:NTP pyrophosphatase (non-canonical NTP hydrolase)